MPDYSDQWAQTRLKAQGIKKGIKKLSPKRGVTAVSEVSDVEFLLLFCLAGLKDILDGLTLGTIGWLVNILVIIVLGFWSLVRLHKFPTKKFIAGAIGDSIPLISILPFWTGFVLLIFLEQKGFMPKWIGKLAKATK
jgi:hypothetical protein